MTWAQWELKPHGKVKVGHDCRGENVLLIRVPEVWVIGSFWWKLSDGSSNGNFCSLCRTTVTDLCCQSNIQWVGNDIISLLSPTRWTYRRFFHLVTKTGSQGRLYKSWEKHVSRFCHKVQTGSEFSHELWPRWSSLYKVLGEGQNIIGFSWHTSSHRVKADRPILEGSSHCWAKRGSRTGPKTELLLLLQVLILNSDLKVIHVWYLHSYRLKLCLRLKQPTCVDVI